MESVYLAAMLVVGPVGLAALFLCGHAYWPASTTYSTFSHYSYAWLGGLLGGTLFSVKWLYHSVAHGLWNQDRRLWRLFTPHLSAGLAFAVIILVESRLLGILDAGIVAQSKGTLGISFLVGYFSDSVVAKLAEVAKNLFGENPPQRVVVGPRRRLADTAEGVAEGRSESGDPSDVAAVIKVERAGDTHIVITDDPTPTASELGPPPGLP